MLGVARKSVPAGFPYDDSNPLIEASFFWETYALAVQVFAGMTVEAVLNTYGLVRFGEELFKRYFRQGGPVQRLKLMMEYGPEIKLTNDDHMIHTLGSLVNKRNPIVHMQSDEEVFESDGRIILPAPAPVDELAGAENAVSEMEEFLRSFADFVGKHDIESWTYVATL